MGTGGALAGIAYGMAGYLELYQEVSIKKKSQLA